MSRETDSSPNVPASASSASPAPHLALALTLDVLLVVVFAITGRASHTEGLNLGEIWVTAWPFLAGLALSWLATRAWRRPFGAPWPGAGLWVGTVAIGMLLRLVSGAGTALPFVIVATITLAVFLIGWRGIAALVWRLRS